MEIKTLIQEKEKELKGWRNSITSYKRCVECNDFLPETEINRCVEIIETLKQCQTIEDENIKKEIEFLDGIIICGFTTDDEMHKELREHNMLIESKIKELKQQLNPAQTKNGKD
jgi:hypothetical protein